MDTTGSDAGGAAAAGRADGVVDGGAGSDGAAAGSGAAGGRRLTYAGKLILAPMVRCGTLPLRLLSLRYGADIVYSEELIAWKLRQCERVVNDVFGTVDFVHPKMGEKVYRTCAEEAGLNVVQIGAADDVAAVQAATLVAGDCAGIDCNMGCPKRFSLQGGMGAALLKKPETAASIIRALKRNLSIPVTCKIRILGDDPTDLDATVEFAKQMEAAGAEAIGVHVRTVKERPKDPAHWPALTPVVSAVRIPVIANGDAFTWEDCEDIFAQTGVSSVMIARGALHETSLFRRARGRLPMMEVMRDYTKIAADVGNSFANTKYTLMQMARGCKMLTLPIGHEFSNARRMSSVADALGIREYVDACEARLRSQMHKVPEEKRKYLFDSVSSRKYLDAYFDEARKKEQEERAASGGGSSEAEPKSEGATGGAGGAERRDRDVDAVGVVDSISKRPRVDHDIRG